MKRTDKELFNDHHEMMNVWQIGREIDTFNLDIIKKHENLNQQFKTNFLTRTLRSSIISGKHQSIKQFYDSLYPEDFKRSVENAQNLVRSSSGYIDSINSEIKNKEILKLDYLVGWHEKINIPFICIVLFFVGAPLGAIIKKGGMGLPVVVAVLLVILRCIYCI